MFGYNYSDDEGEHCVRCGHYIPMEVGMGPFSCPGCGEDYRRTPEQEEEDKARDEEFMRKARSGEHYTEQIIDHLESEIFYFEMLASDANMPDSSMPVSALMRIEWVIKKLRAIINDVKRDK